MAIVIMVSPSRNPDGRRAYSTRGPLWDGVVDGRVIITRSTQPLLDGCRVLMGEGADPAARIVMRHQGADHDALRSTLGVAAGLSIAEGERLPRFVPWVPLSRATETPPMRPDDQPVQRTARHGRTYGRADRCGWSAMTRTEALDRMERLADAIDRYPFNCAAERAELELLRALINHIDAAPAPKRKRRRAA